MEPRNNENESTKNNSLSWENPTNQQNQLKAYWAFTYALPYLQNEITKECAIQNMDKLFLILKRPLIPFFPNITKKCRKKQFFQPCTFFPMKGPHHLKRVSHCGKQHPRNTKQRKNVPMNPCLRILKKNVISWFFFDFA